MAEKPKAGRVMRLEVDNIKKLRAVRITPEGNLVVVSGDNDQGKSSILDAIRFALGGPTAMKDTPRIVRDGELAGRVLVELEDLIVTRTVVDGRQSVVVQSKDGAKFGSPQAMLDKLLTTLTFDPLQFANLKPKEQRDTLISLVDLGFDPDEVDAQIKTAYDLRATVGQEVTRLKGAIDSAPPIPEDTPESEVSSAELASSLEAAGAHNRAVVRTRVQRSDLYEEIDIHEKEILLLQDQIAALRAQITAKAAEAQRLGDVLANSKPEIDEDAIRQQLMRADEVNRAVRNRARLIEVESQYVIAKRQYDSYTDEIESLRAKKTSGLAAAKMPIDGLAFDEHGVLFNGIPLSQASESQRVKASAAIQMALNPDLRVMLIDNGNSLDKRNLAALDELAAAHDYQIWMTWVGESEKSQVVIVDGEVSE